MEEIPESVTLRRLKPQDPGRPTDTRVLAVKEVPTRSTLETLGDHLSVTPVAGWGPGEPRPGFDQQPIEAAAIADACARALTAGVQSLSMPREFTEVIAT